MIFLFYQTHKILFQADNLKSILLVQFGNVMAVKT